MTTSVQVAATLITAAAAEETTSTSGPKGKTTTTKRKKNSNSCLSLSLSGTIRVEDDTTETEAETETETETGSDDHLTPTPAQQQASIPPHSCNSRSCPSILACPPPPPFLEDQGEAEAEAEDYDEVTIDEVSTAIEEDDYTFVTLQSELEEQEQQVEELHHRKVLKVRFHPNLITKIYEVPSLDDYSDEERQRYWILKQEKQQMETKLRQTIAKMLAREKEMMIQKKQRSNRSKGSKTVIIGHPRRYRGLEVFSSLNKQQQQQHNDTTSNVNSRIELIVNRVMDEQDKQWMIETETEVLRSSKSQSQSKSTQSKHQEQQLDQHDQHDDTDDPTIIIANVSEQISYEDKQRSINRAKQDQEEAMQIYSRSSMQFFQNYFNINININLNNINININDDNIIIIKSSSSSTSTSSRTERLPLPLPLELSPRVIKKAIQRHNKIKLQKKN